MFFSLNSFNWISIIASSIVIIITYFKWRYSYWSRKGVPTPKTHFPFGHDQKRFLRQESIGEIVAGVYNEYKPKGIKYCGYYSVLKPVLVLIDLDLIKNVMTKDFASFMNRGLYHNEKVDPLTGNLSSLRGPRWKHLRAKLTPTFTSGKMKMMFPTILECSDTLIDVVDEATVKGLPFEVKDIIARFATDIIGSCAFGIDCNTLKNPNSEFRERGQKVFQFHENKFFALMKMVVLIGCPRLMDIFQIPLFSKQTSDFFFRLVRNTVQYREKNGIIRKDFMHLLIQLKNNVTLKDNDAAGLLFRDGEQSGNALSIEEVTAQAFVFFLGGFETTSNTLPFFFYEIASDQNLQERVRAEVRNVLKAHDGKITYDSLVDMTYMDMCIKETLRKYPPVPLLSRDCTQTYKLPNSELVLEKGMRVYISALGIQHDPDYFPNPQKFDPERFNLDNKNNRHPFSWLAFGEGPRSCIGERFAMTEMKVVIAVLLNNYKFTINEKTCDPLVLDPTEIIPYVKGGIWMNTHKI